MGAQLTKKDAGPVAEVEDPSDRLGREAHLMTTLVGDRATYEIEKACRSHGISAALYPVLWVLCLADPPDGLPMGAIADGLITRASDITRLVDRLANAGLVTRATSHLDRRVVLVRPTDEGRGVFERLTPEIKQIHRDQWAGLNPNDLEQLLSLLNRAFWSGTSTSEEQRLSSRQAG